MRRSGWVVACVIALLGVGATSASASIFANWSRWPTAADGRTVVPVCVEEGSSAEQREAVGIHDPNPSLEDVVGQVRDALREGWEAYSSVRFVGWDPCGEASGRTPVIRLTILPTVANVSGVGVESDDLGFPLYPATSFK